MTLDLDRATLAEAAAALAAGDISSVELLNAQLDRIDIFNPSVNAVVAFDIERAMADAQTADEHRASGATLPPLHGVPLTVKDTYETAGCVTTAGSPANAEHIPETDADVIAGLRADGAVIYGKTNVPLFAGDHQTYNEVYGLTRNPWDPDRTAGGSSGGAAVSVACGFSLGEVGSDIGGSIRVPAHFNGLFGLKSSWGAISERGHITQPPGPVGTTDLTVMGPLARSADDLRLLLDASMRFGAMKVGGVDPVPGAALPEPVHTEVAGLRVGVWLDDPIAPVDAVTRAGVERFVATLGSVGAELDEAARPSLGSSDLHDIYSRLLTGVNGSGWPKRVRERFAAAASEIDGPLDAADPDTFGQRLARDGTADHAFWLSANERRMKAQAAWSALFDRVDVMVMPVSQTQAFEHDTETAYADRMVAVDRGPDHDTHRAYHELLFWAGLATMPGLPSVVMPLGAVNGLPLGVQIVGPRWADRTLLGLAATMSEVAELGFQAPTLITG